MVTSNILTTTTTANKKENKQLSEDTAYESAEFLALGEKMA